MNNEDLRHSEVLGPLGVSEVEERLYRALLQHPSSSSAQLARIMGCRLKEARGALDSLEAKGLVTRATGTEESRFVALDPHTVIDGLFSRRRDELDNARARGIAVLDQLQEVLAPKRAQELITTIEGNKVLGRQCGLLQDATKQEILALYKAPDGGVVDALTPNDPEIRLLGQGVTYRVVYDQAALRIDGFLPLLEHYVAVGEQARVVNELPIRMMVFDRKVALVPLDYSHPQTQGAAVIRSTWLIDAFCALFEGIWKRASPLPFGTDQRPSVNNRTSDRRAEKDREILALLVAGLKDDVIAQQMGLDVTTVRRRIKAMMESLGVTTRFQAGLQAGRQGWI